MAKGIKRLVIVLISGFALYSWLGFLLIPSVALHLINQQLGVYANSPAQLQRLEFNPFTLELNAWGFQVGERQPLEQNPAPARRTVAASAKPSGAQSSGRIKPQHFI